MDYPYKITLEEAVRIIKEQCKEVGMETVQLLCAIGRMSGADLYATMNNPPFPKSAMDGYAIVAADSKEKEKKLSVIDTVYAGEVSEKEVKEGTAIRIMTGAAIPHGATAVIKQEDVTQTEDGILCNKQLCRGDNICVVGEDIKEGDLLVSKNSLLDASHIGILASSGITTVPVYKKPKVSLITTGSELVSVGEPIKPGKIYNSNSFTLYARLKELDCEIPYCVHAKDEISEIANQIKQAELESDLILTTGGASVGEKDFMKEVIKQLGGTILFWKIQIKPGSSVVCGSYNGKLILSLSGNPTAAMTTFELLGKTAISTIRGEEATLSFEHAVLKTDFLKKSPVRRFLRGKIGTEGVTQTVTITQTKKGNGSLSATLHSDCLIELEKGNEGVHCNETVRVIKFK